MTTTDGMTDQMNAEWSADSPETKFDPRKKTGHAAEEMTDLSGGLHPTHTVG
jgi:hypothetical protein